MYIDSNGIIHGATHGNEGVSQRQAREVIATAVVKYVDMMVKLARPQQLLYVAIDGVAPRAKMNQQRARRYGAAKDAAIARAEAAKRGEVYDDEAIFDSNCITPGTPFMMELHEDLQFALRKKLKEDSQWHGLQLIYSGHDQPGEGEHKIVSYIRAMKSQPGWSPNTRHIMAGLDADLVMLSLALHEPHFSLLREQIDFNAFRANANGTKEKTQATSEVKWQMLHIGLLREYLEMDMKPVREMSFEWDGERAMDDFVLLTVVCGNDFVPHLPSLDIGEGALSELLATYRERLPDMGGYLVDNGKINFARLQVMIDVLGDMEAMVFEQRAADAKKRARRDKKQEERWAEQVRDSLPVGADDSDIADLVNSVIASAAASSPGGEDDAASPATTPASAAAALAGHGVALSSSVDVSEDWLKDALTAAARLDLDDFKAKYYLEKFGIGPGIPRTEEVMRLLVASFAEALQWVMLYYYQGVPSWNWFFPFHYAPMTSDLKRLSTLDIRFDLGQPSPPFVQLMCTLPPSSASFLPPQLASLMTSPDSPLAEYYPPAQDIQVDMNGKRNPWEGVILTPFMPIDKLLRAVAERLAAQPLSAADALRNAHGPAMLISYDADAHDVLVAPHAALHDVPDCNTRVQVFTEPAMPAEGFAARPCEGCVVPAPGYPTLHSALLSTQTRATQLNVFGTPSRKDTVLLAVADGRVISRDGTKLPARRPHFSVQYAPTTCVNGSAESESELKLDVSGLSAVDAAQQLAGACIAVDWPYLKPAQVVALADSSHVVEWCPAGQPVPQGRSVLPCARGNLLVSTSSPQAAAEMQAAAHGLSTALLSGGRGLAAAGIVIGVPSLLVRVRMLVGMRRNPRTGELRRAFATAEGRHITDAEGFVGYPTGEVWVPAQLLWREQPSPDQRWAEHGEASPLERFPVGSSVAVVRGPYRGAMAVVTGDARCPAPASGEKRDREAGAANGLQLSVTVRKPEPAFGRSLVASVQDRYFDSAAVAKLLKINPRVLGKMAGSCYVEPGRFDLGLNLFTPAGLYLPGYVRPVFRHGTAPAWTGGAQRSAAVAAAPAGSKFKWEYTERAVAVLLAYQKAHPAVWDAVEADPGRYKYGASFMGGVPAVERVKTWLRQLDTASKPLAPQGTTAVAPDAIVALQHAGERVAALAAEAAASEPPVQAAVLVEDVYAPEQHDFAVGDIGGGRSMGNLGADGSLSAPPQLGDRVMNLSWRRAPLGARGTVVAIHASSGYVEVVYDEPFVGGDSLGGFCNPGRGGLLTWASQLNLSADPEADAVRQATAQRVAAEPKPVQLAGRLVGAAAAAGAAGSGAAARAQPKLQFTKEDLRATLAACAKALSPAVLHSAASPMLCDMVSSDGTGWVPLGSLLHEPLVAATPLAMAAATRPELTQPIVKLLTAALKAHGAALRAVLESELEVDTAKLAVRRTQPLQQSLSADDSGPADSAMLPSLSELFDSALRTGAAAEQPAAAAAGPLDSLFDAPAKRVPRSAGHQSAAGPPSQDAKGFSKPRKSGRSGGRGAGRK